MLCKTKHASPPSPMRSELARARGLGSAKHGTAEWRMMRITSLALIPLTLWFLFILIGCLAGADYATTLVWLRHPLFTAMLALFLVCGFHHAASGLQTVYEDYLHCPAMRAANIVITKFLAALLTVTGLVALGRIAFGS